MKFKKKKLKKYILFGAIVLILLYFSVSAYLEARMEKLEESQVNEVEPDEEDIEEEATESEEEEIVVDYVEKEEATELEIKEKESLYENTDDMSVIKMYLTVSSGNEADGSNHTWTEVNTYSAYYYDDLGIDRYMVEGVLQIDDGNGLDENSFGYNEVVPNVSVQVRGQTSSKSSVKNYKVRIKDGRGYYNNQRTLNLNKHLGDPLRLTNKVCYDLLSEVPQLIGGRTQFVQLFVKDETEGGSGEYTDYGLYTMVEQVNKKYLKSRGMDENGQLYKVTFFEWDKYDEIAVDIESSEFDQDAFEQKLEIKGDRDTSKLNGIVEKISNRMIPIDEILEEHFDVENICYWMAFNIMIGNHDSAARNAFLYSPLNSDKFYFICWDMDASLRKTYFKTIDYSDGASWERGMSQYLGLILVNRMLKEEKYRDMLSAAVEDIHDNYVNGNTVSALVNRYKTVVEPFLYGGADTENARIEQDMYEYLCESMSEEIEENYAFYKESVHKPWPFYIGFPQMEGDKTVLNWDASYDVNGESIRYDYMVARDYKFEDVVSEGKGLIAPSITIDALDPGVYFLRVIAINESGYKQDAFDYYTGKGRGKTYACKAFEIKANGSVVDYNN